MRRNLVLVLTLAALPLMLATACGGGDSSDENNGPSRPQALLMRALENKVRVPGLIAVSGAPQAGH